MTEVQSAAASPVLAGTKQALVGGEQGRITQRVFSWLIKLVFLTAILSVTYWLFLASDRYVSESNVIIRKTDSIGMPSFDIAMLVSGVAGGVDRPSQLLLREYLLSVDMLQKLDEALDLRTHYSDSSHDIVSRMWFHDASMEWFHRHYLRRVDAVYDDFAGVLRVTVQAYDADMAQAIARMLVQEGERYMNVLGHQLAEVQVSFLTGQVNQAQQRFLQASQMLLRYQNQQGMLSPLVTAESISTIIAELESQRSKLQTQLATLPRTLDKNHSNIIMLKQALAAVDKQLQQEKTKLATPAGGTLNASVEKFQRLEMDVTFTQELYKSSLMALEKGRIDATRMLEKVSVLQSPTLPQYPMEPRRIYNTFVTLLLALMLAGIFKLLESIVMDHVD